jgi:hypothetical protein
MNEYGVKEDYITAPSYAKGYRLLHPSVEVVGEDGERATGGWADFRSPASPRGRSDGWSAAAQPLEYFLMALILLNVLAFILDSVEHIRDNATWGTVRSC